MARTKKFDSAFKLVWKMETPIMIKVFAWKCFINKLPTRDALAFRGILPSSSSSCVFCCANGESSLHSLLLFHNASLVWKDIADCIGFEGYKAENFKESFLNWFSFSKNAKVRKGKEGVVWMAVCWTLWLVRNDVVFREIRGTFPILFER
ncbi:uncharacterized protein LOC131637409 [Vicia villosa]|uniref:uncharacterized protein LOC131637409 n=1 Tax=Vicia villosa TaxID=3911 RepID=UPI00273CF2B3|nr:uncharacterized protein LOC131637409 [Vicia villosa]